MTTFRNNLQDLLNAYMVLEKETESQRKLVISLTEDKNGLKQEIAQLRGQLMETEAKWAKLSKLISKEVKE